MTNEEQIMKITLKTNEIQKEFTAMILNMMSEGEMTDRMINLAGRINQQFGDIIPLMLEIRARMN